MSNANQSSEKQTSRGAFAQHVTPKPRAAFAIFALIALALFAGISFADISVTSYAVSPPSVKPGATGLVTMTIANTGTGPVSAIRLTSVGSGYLSSNADISVGDIAAGGSTIISVPFTVSQDALPGIYIFQARINGYVSSSSGGNALNTLTSRTFTVPVAISSPPIFLVSSASSTVYTDGTFTLAGTIKNSGGSVRNVRLYIGQSQDPRNSTSGAPSSFVPMSSPIFIGDLSNQSDFQSQIMVSSNVSSGVYTLPIGIIYDDLVGNTLFDKATILVNVVKKSPDFLVLLTSNNPKPGQTTKLVVNIVNSGEKTAYNMRVALGQNSALTPLGSSVEKIGDLEANASTEVTFDIGVNNVQPGFYTIPFTLSYQNSKGDEQDPVEQNAGLNVVVTSDVDYFVSSKPTPIVSGDPNSISIQVSNIGSSPIAALRLAFGSDAFTVLDASNLQFVGSLNPDDFSTVLFKVQSKDVPEGLYPINITSTFRDSYNVEHTVSKTLEVEIVSKETAAKAAGASSGGLGILPLLALFAIVAAAVWYFRFRKVPAKPKNLREHEN